MKANWLPLSAAVALALGSVTASAVDFHAEILRVFTDLCG